MLVTTIKTISVIAPLLNEERHLEQFTRDLAAQDFKGRVQVIVADGGSTDGSIEKLRSASELHALDLVLLTDISGWVSHALNACIDVADGDLIVRLDCHSRYPENYLRLCALAAEETDAMVVGGVILPEGHTLTERAVACAMDTAFGGIGFYRTFSANAGPLARVGALLGLSESRGLANACRVDADTVTFGAFRPEAFERAGMFDEALRRNQDDEFNLRVRRAGGRVLLDHEIHVYYTPRGTLKGVFRQYYQYGFWKVPVILKHRHRPNPRSLVPLTFVCFLGGLAPAAVVSRTARRFLGAQLGAYAVMCLFFAGRSIHNRRESWSLFPRVVTAFPAFHVGYGLGMLRGWARALFRS